MYSLAAGAAGVGVLALAGGAEGEVVYTPAHHVILRHSSFKLDLNHDGKVDFEINQTSGCTSGGKAGVGSFCQTRLYAYVPFYQDPGNAVAGDKNFPFHAYALKGGAKIGANLAFGGTALYFRSRGVDSVGNCEGSWTNARNRYLGLKFLIDGEVHYGWARLNSACSLGSKAAGVLTGYAYETIAHQAIVAGQTNSKDEISDEISELEADPAFGRLPPEWASIGLLALGTSGRSAGR
jgi:hypothetical protein